MIERLLQPRLLDLATRYPVLTLTGPRQSGKTTLSRMAFTGSQNLALADAGTQSLAGRTTLTELLPLSLEEIRRFPSPPAELDALLWQGGYPV